MGDNGLTNSISTCDFSIVREVGNNLVPRRFLIRHTDECKRENISVFRHAKVTTLLLFSRIHY